MNSMNQSGYQSINQSAALLRGLYPNETFWLLQKKSGKPNATLSADHWLIGFFDGQPIKGNPIRMTRLANKFHPEGMWGIFTSSAIVDFQNQTFQSQTDNRIDSRIGWVIQTENSVYELTKLIS